MQYNPIRIYIYNIYKEHVSNVFRHGKIKGLINVPLLAIAHGPRVMSIHGTWVTSPTIHQFLPTLIVDTAIFTFMINYIT